MTQIIQHYLQRLLAESTPQSPLWNQEALLSGKPPKWNYIDGCMCASLMVIGEKSGNKEYEEFVDSFMNFYVREDGSIVGYSVDEYNIDNLNGGRALIEIYKRTNKPKYKRAIELLHTQLLNHPRTKSGNFWHKKIYPHQIWLDGLFMAQVFYALYEREFGTQNYKDTINQFRYVRENMFDSQKKLYYHGLDTSKSIFWANQKGLSQCFWLRAEGWFLTALADVAEIIDDESIKDIFKEACSGIAQYIDAETNMLFQVIDMPHRQGNYAETSGSAMVAYAFLKGARLGILPNEFATLGKKIFNGICAKYLTEDQGKMNLGGICLVAGLGPENNLRRNGTFEYYICEPIVQNDAKGVAPFIMAFTELL